MPLRIGSILMVLFFLIAFPLAAAEKNWAGSGDGLSWSDDDNWSPAVEPSSADNVTIDAENVTVNCDETFSAKSIIVGGRETSNLTTSNFIFGTVSPDSVSDIAMMARSGGTITLRGAGTITLQGQYKDSQETLNAEPSFMFWID